VVPYLLCMLPLLQKSATLTLIPSPAGGEGSYLPPLSPCGREVGREGLAGRRDKLAEVNRG